MIKITIIILIIIGTGLFLQFLNYIIHPDQKPSIKKAAKNKDS